MSGDKISCWLKWFSSWRQTTGTRAVTIGGGGVGCRRVRSTPCHLIAIEVKVNIYLTVALCQLDIYQMNVYFLSVLRYKHHLFLTEMFSEAKFRLLWLLIHKFTNQMSKWANRKMAAYVGGFLRTRQKAGHFCTQLNILHVTIHVIFESDSFGSVWLCA